MSITTAQAVLLLENVLFESPTLAAANAAQWVSISQADTASTVISDVAAAVAGTAEAGIAEQVVRYYEGALGREPTIQDIAYYVKIAEAGLSSSQIAQGASAVSQATWNQIASYFAASPEFQGLYGGSESAVVSALYHNILGRAPSAEETSYYQKVLDGGTSVSTLVQYFVSSPEFQDQSDAKIEAKLATTGVTAASGLSAPTGSAPGVGSGVSVVDLNSSAGAGASTITLTTVATHPTGVTITNPIWTTGGTLTLTGVGDGEQVVYSSGGVAHVITVSAGTSTVDIPAGASGVELVGVQVGSTATVVHT